MYENPYQYLSGNIGDKKLIRAGFEEKLYDTGQIKLNYVVGPDNGPNLLLIPAQMGTWESYGKVLIPLSQQFKVYAIDIRGHGKSSWTPGDYSWSIIGQDMRSFIDNVVQGKVIISGNSSGGIIALWCAANLGSEVAGIVIEDAPVFSAEMPRFKERDRFVYNGLKHIVEKIGDLDNRDLADYFSGQEMPVSENRVKKMPDWMIRLLSKRIKKFQTNHPNQPLEVGFPSALKQLLKSLSMFDPDFARAFVDGRFYQGIHHAEALKASTCPILCLHANWKRYEKYGLVGALDDQDVQHILELAPQTIYKKIPANHVIHAFKPRSYIQALLEFKDIIQNH
ncbi:alpha/beta hydrolase [Streptococcus constellatus]|uniref:Hydrolase, alpha/beta domain protein n=1 Tax=Streptococcus constellatus subsp. constellatus SK53 TaxID=1095730 RepID=A0AAD2Y3V1_STRCV|nr:MULTISPECIES: alpha/beta hydrolase [Streptococcus anginosus group]EID18856.1 hydrolase, alpha/beta domain protein [Streptococcus constellatus subsp. constellatus SK53]MCW1052083.1 alpha/beta hydrolase [Streptococcus anginosus]MDP1485072.1 alpha/beta hydrolase [Streptococcus constellatus]QQT06405.1 alpha/beta hydrolase [Streptococcus constellatus]SUN40330.1 putative hydrolase or acyltransferase [Streptococcus constellatus]